MWNDETSTFRVTVNHAGDYSLWPEDRDLPPGWLPMDVTGTKAECLSYIDANWHALRETSAAQRPAMQDAG